jgi:hypothetical protein
MNRNIKATGLAACWLFAMGLNADAVLVASYIETFSGGGGGAPGGGYSMTSSNGTFSLQQSTVTDGNVFDGADDGYAQIARILEQSTSHVINADYGIIEASDVGRTVTIDAGFRHEAGINTNWAIQVGANLGSVSEVAVKAIGSFGTGNASNDTSLQLSTISPLNSDPTVLSYLIQAGDVGSHLFFEYRALDSNNTAGRPVYIDSISYSLSPAVPEPSSVALLLAGMGGFIVRRRR